MAIIPSDNMSLPVPQVGTESGPQYAEDINSCLDIIDQHNHTPGLGVPIPSSGLSINADLTFNNNNLINARSLRLQPQGAPLALTSDIGCLYESGVDLYYNDGLGNQVRITQSGGVAGSPGSIANLTSPASASYVSADKTFVWESDANTPANLDLASLILRNLSANSKGMTINPPSAMGADFAITFPALPVGQRILTMDNSGAIAASWNVDNSSIVVAANILKVNTQGIQQSMLALRPIQPATIAAGEIGISPSTGAFSSNNTTPAAVTNTAMTITTLGRPVRLELIADGNTTPSGYAYIQNSAGGGAVTNKVFIYRDGVKVAAVSFLATAATAVPPSVVSYLDPVAAGTYLYEMYIQCDSGVASPLIQIINCKFVVYEI